MTKHTQALAGRPARAALLLIVPTLVWSTVATAVGDVSGTTIVEVALTTTNYAYIRLQNAPSGAPACANNGYWHFTLGLDDAVGKNLYTLLLMAQAAQKTVRVSGTGSCTQRPDIESLATMYITN